jgi:hypothetical protein
MCGPGLLRLVARIRLVAGTSGSADCERLILDAIELASAQQARPWELGSAMSLVRFLAPQSRREAALTMLAEIYNWFTEGFDTVDLKDAKALLDELSN